MSSSPSLKRNGNGSFTSETSDALHDRVPAPLLLPILMNAGAAAALLGVSKRAFHALRKRPDFPHDATVVLGSRCVRFRHEALRTFALLLAAAPQARRKQPRQ